ncbi:MAG: heavy metal translocating P-type ATPase [Alphaproteobacteria bacterium]|nr:heavy metal translocating P-type ATPase [Alphaproteobacteria bacterium]
MAEALKHIDTGPVQGAVPAIAAPAGALLKTTTLIVENMACGGCMRKVEKALGDVAGIEAVRANLSAKRVAVTGDAGRISAPQLVETLAAAGFRAQELRFDAAPDTQRAERDLLRRVAVAGFAAANIMLLSVSVWAGGSGDMSPAVQSLFHWLSAAIALPVVAYAGMPFFRSAAEALRARRLNMDVPISLGVLLATGMSFVQTMRGSEQIYFDAAVTLLFFLLLGRFLDTSMRRRAEGAAANLLGLRAMTANVRHADGTIEAVAARDLLPGMHVVVATGERIAADGRIVDGRGEIDEAIITGESLPRVAAMGDNVFAGSVSLDGGLVIEATATDENTLLSDIGRLMTAAEQGRGRYVRLADRAAAIYAPAVHILGLVTVVGWMLAGAGWEAALTAGIATLIITCPCALALAVPAVQVAAASRLFAKGIIVKAADGLERLAETDTIVFDKTGTLTLGTPGLNSILNGGDDDLGEAATLAIQSKHPYARALVEAARDRGLALHAVSDVAEMPGRGLRRETALGEIRLGSSEWCGVEVSDAAALWFIRPGQPPVGFVFDEVLRGDAGAVVGRLRAAGFKTEVLSGDRTVSVRTISERLGIPAWRARQTPVDKIGRINALKAAGHSVLMVGDGLNDAPALAAAHASLSPSSAADISQTTADMIFQGDKLEGVIVALGVAREARRMALQNFAIALAYNAVFVPLAMAGMVTPLLAAIAMSASSIGVTANALRLRVKKLKVR